MRLRRHGLRVQSKQLIMSVLMPPDLVSEVFDLLILLVDQRVVLLDRLQGVVELDLQDLVLAAARGSSLELLLRLRVLGLELLNLTPKIGVGST